MDMSFTVNENYVIHNVGKRVTFFDPDNSLLHTLNETATIIFNQINKGKAYEDIVKKFINNYEVSPEKAMIDVKEFTNFLLKKKILLKKQM